MVSLSQQLQAPVNCFCSMCGGVYAQQAVVLVNAAWNLLLPQQFPNQGHLCAFVCSASASCSLSLLCLAVFGVPAAVHVSITLPLTTVHSVFMPCA